MASHAADDASIPPNIIDTHGALAPWDTREWLLTNGYGAFAMGTVAGLNTRRYHGLLIGAANPPLRRCNALSRVGEILVPDGTTDLIELSVNRFGQTVHPRGYEHLLRFVHHGDAVEWVYRAALPHAGAAHVIKRLRLVDQSNAIELTYAVTPSSAVTLRLLPFTALRDFHHLRRAGGEMLVSDIASTVRVSDGPLAIDLRCPAAFTRNPEWWYGHTYPVETERGQDDTEDLFCPGHFAIHCPAGVETRITLRATMSPSPPPPGGQLHPTRLAKHASPLMRRLARSAEAFVVGRADGQGRPGVTILAGYPWFTDWGRDTFISLPGLLLATGRHDEARQALSTFAQYVSEGMVPNNFDDNTHTPSYNTVDASLWFIHSAYEYRRVTNDTGTFDTLLGPACRRIVEGYRRGTRFGIGVDPADGLVAQGDDKTQLTWMDAKYDGVAFTPRPGKPVEIQALWHHALSLLGETDAAERVAAAIREKFWISESSGLADYVARDGSRDTRTRPNQIFAVSLEPSPLTPAQQSAVVEVVRARLLTPMGLRTLAADEPGYHGRYTGPQSRRDAAYHNGTVWAWLIGPFIEAHLRTGGFTPAARSAAAGWLAPLIAHLDDACLESVSEIFEGDAPHRPVGAPAQAWSVAELLRACQLAGL